MRHRAVVFDLWQTLVVWDYEAAMESYRLMAAHVGVDPDRFVELWRATGDQRGTGPLADALRLVCEGLAVDPANVEALAETRRDAARKVLVPRPGAVETLAELRRRGHALGLISNCSGDVADVWHETRLAEHFDAVVLSCEARMAKPDPGIYRLACTRLAVEPADCLFVDDQPAFVEGARAAGMDAVLIAPPPGAEQPEDAGRWNGVRVESLEDVLSLA